MVTVFDEISKENANLKRVIEETVVVLWLF